MKKRVDELIKELRDIFKSEGGNIFINADLKLNDNQRAEYYLFAGNQIEISDNLFKALTENEYLIRAIEFAIVNYYLLNEDKFDDFVNAFEAIFQNEKTSFSDN